jgi:hypothetical protein
VSGFERAWVVVDNRRVCSLAGRCVNACSRDSFFALPPARLDQLALLCASSSRLFPRIKKHDEAVLHALHRWQHPVNDNKFHVNHIENLCPLLPRLEHWNIGHASLPDELFEAVWPSARFLIYWLRKIESRYGLDRASMYIRVKVIMPRILLIAIGDFDIQTCPVAMPT